MKQVECIQTGPEPWNNVVVVDREPRAVGDGEARVAVRGSRNSPHPG